MPELTAGRLAVSRWRGQPGRLEVWYSSITDPVTGTGIWLHHELVAPADGTAAFAHGWIALFRPGRGPVLERFGPDEWIRPATGFVAPGVVHAGDRLSGTAGRVSWDLRSSPGGPPLTTFPGWAWQRELLPAAQVVAEPGSRFSGEISFGDERLRLEDAPGANARIYGDRNARRWGWLHADLGGGDVCEVVTAVSGRAGLRRLPPLALVRLRLRGQDLPADPLLAAWRLRTRLGPNGWSVTGRLGAGRLEIEVRLPDDQTVEVTYLDPDGTTLSCRNSERARARLRLWKRAGRSWELDQEWLLADTAHAEVGGDVVG